MVRTFLLYTKMMSTFNIFVPGNQRPVKTETNRRTATDEFTLVSDNTQVIVEYIKF